MLQGATRKKPGIASALETLFSMNPKEGHFRNPYFLIVIFSCSWSKFLTYRSHQPERTLEMEWALAAQCSAAEEMGTIEERRAKAWEVNISGIGSKGSRWRDLCLLSGGFKLGVQRG